MFIYSNKKCNVRWGNTFSNTFNAQNGVRQGAVSSPVLFCIYIDKVIKFNDWMMPFYFLLCRAGLQKMVKICENFANANKLKFSTNIRIEKCKTKCLIFSVERVNYNEITPVLFDVLP